MRRDLLKDVPHEPMLVVATKQLTRFLERYTELEDPNMQFLDCRSATASAWNAFDCNHMLTKCETWASDTVKTKHFNDDAINKKRSTDNENREEVTLELKGRCSNRQKLSVLADDDVNFSVLRRLKEVLNEAGLEQLTSFPVVHCPEAFGVILKARERLNNAGAMKPGWKIVYSGDTRLCMEVIQASQATFEDSLAGEAVARNHSTTKGAIEVGESSGAYRVILTHFS